MAKTQKNKATSYHLGQLKAKLAKLKRELLTPQSSGGGGGCKNRQRFEKKHGPNFWQLDSTWPGRASLVLGS